MPSMLRTGTDYNASGSTRDIHELQAALQAAQLTATGTGSKYSGICIMKCCFFFLPTAKDSFVCLACDRSRRLFD